MNDAAGVPDRKYSAPAAGCAADVLHFLARRSAAWTSAEIAREIDSSRSLVFRVMRELERRDLVERGEDGRYSLSFGVLEISGAFLARSAFARSAQLTLRELSRQTGETSNMGVLREADVLYVLKQEGRNSIVTISHVGSRIPAHCSALGKAILAQLPDDEVGRRVAGNLQRRMTQRSIGTMDELLADLAETRDRGYALEVGESILGRCCIAVPVPLAEHSREVAGISVSFAGEDPRSPVGEEILEHIRFAAGRLRREAAARTLVDQLQTGSESDVSWPSMPSPG